MKKGRKRALKELEELCRSLKRAAKHTQELHDKKGSAHSICRAEVAENEAAEAICRWVERHPRTPKNKAKRFQFTPFAKL